MKVTNNKTENRMTYLTVEMEKADMEPYLEKTYKRMVEKIDIPGFRKGNAPREVLEKHVGRDKLLEEARTDMMPQVCSQVIKEQGLEAFGQPMVKITREDPVAFELVVPLVPIVELCAYHSIRMQPEPVEVKDEDVNMVLEGLRHQFARYEPTDQPIKMGDSLTIDIESTYLESPFIRSKGMRFVVQPDYPPEIPGLAEHFVGMKKDEVKEFKHKLPEDYGNKLVAGKEVAFKVKILEVKEEKLPELDDSFVKLVTPELKTLDALRERITKNMRADYAEQSRNDFEEKILETMTEKSKLEVPQFMIDSEAEYLFNESLQKLEKSCQNREEYERKLKRLQIEQLQEECKAAAGRRIKWSLILKEVAKKENVEVSEGEIDAEIERRLEAAATDKEKEEQFRLLNEPASRDGVKALLSALKTGKLLVEIITSPEEAPKAPKTRKTKKTQKGEKKETEEKEVTE